MKKKDTKDETIDFMDLVLEAYNLNKTKEQKIKKYKQTK